MNRSRILLISSFLVLGLLSNALPCGPGYVSPIFDTNKSPERPFSNYASGQLGIIKPSFRRSVLFAAYRHINGGGLNGAEQAAMVDVWRAEFENREFADLSIDDAVRAWIARRAEVVPKEQPVPEIYAERRWGGYEFFPNCTKNAFETALETLNSRVAANGSTDPNVQNWIRAQDAVFLNCSEGKTPPEEAPAGAPEWLQKDRAYQLAAADFYSMDFRSARSRFEAIAEDTASPWAETADYLVGRTLIRQASLSRSKDASERLYEEAETHLQRIASRGGKFGFPAEKLISLIRYRTQPRERVQELAGKLAGAGGGDGFRQDVIDYIWLVDRFTSESLEAEEARKKKESGEKPEPSPASTPETTPTPKEGEIQIFFSNEDFSKSWTIFVRADASDEEALAEAERVAGQRLTEDMRKRVIEGRKEGYSGRIRDTNSGGYEGRYWGDEALTPGLVPDLLRRSEMTDWILNYQMKSPASYQYAVARFRETGGEHWLAAAISKAERSSPELRRMLEAAENANRTSAAYTTIAYHAARLYLDLGRDGDARRLIDGMLASGDLLNASARNSFLELKLTTTDTMDDFLRYSVRTAFNFDFSGTTGTIEDIIAEQNSFFDPEYDKEGREAYEANIEQQYGKYRLYENRQLLDDRTIESLNHHFPTALMLQAISSQYLPSSVRERFAIASWTRAWLLNDVVSMRRAQPELVKYRPDMKAALDEIAAIQSPAARDNALLYFVIKNPILTPFIESGIGRLDNESGAWDANDWWCEPYEAEAGDENSEFAPPKPPGFLKPAQTTAAKNERRRLKEIGDAPKFLAQRVIAWQRRSPADKNIPEALYLMIQSNDWNKWGCGGNYELRNQMIAILKRSYPNTEWAAKIIKEEAERQ
ncbi:MAG: hypothetical protein KF881_05990 [Acidobacteria bacterium]|nr:hypothetical protein [Acidobacteriota bacterium]